MIYQGGYLSLVKYTAFINSLSVELKNSKFCFMIFDIPSSPLGYANDVTTASRNNLDLEFCFSSHLCQMWLIRD